MSYSSRNTMQKINFISRKAVGGSVSLKNRLSVRVVALHDAAAAVDVVVMHWTSLLDARLM